MNKYSKLKKHTPEPWEQSARIADSINSGTKHIAMVGRYQCGDPSVDVWGEEYEANKALILAAIDLLKACERKDKLLERASDILCDTQMANDIDNHNDVRHMELAIDEELDREGI